MAQEKSLSGNAANEYGLAEQDEIASANWRPKVLIFGAVLGAVVGVTAAYLLAQRSEENEPPKMSLGEGVKIGVLVLGLLRSIATL